MFILFCFILFFYKKYSKRNIVHIDNKVQDYIILIMVDHNHIIYFIENNITEILQYNNAACLYKLKGVIGCKLFRYKGYILLELIFSDVVYNIRIENYTIFLKNNLDNKIYTKKI